MPRPGLCGKEALRSSRLLSWNWQTDSEQPHCWFVTWAGHTQRPGTRRRRDEILEALKHTARSAYVSPYSIAAVHAALGEKDQAFRWLNRAYDERDCQITYLALDPHVDPLRSDPRFPPLLARLHLPQ